MRLALKCLIVVVMCLSAFGLYVLGRPFAEIRHRQSLYDTITQDMTLADIIAVLGPPDANGQPLFEGPFWDDAVRDDVSPDTITEAIRYTTSTFYLPVTFEFTFDGQGVIVGKHRYD